MRKEYVILVREADGRVVTITELDGSPNPDNKRHTVIYDDWDAAVADSRQFMLESPIICSVADAP